MTTEDFIKRTPISYGYWTGERGNSKFVVTDEGIEKYLQNGGFKDINSDREIIKSLFKKYRINGIKYKNGIPDFSPVCEFSTKITEPLTGEFENNWPVLHKILAEAMSKKKYLGKKDWTNKDVKDYVSKNWLVLHESIDGKVQLVHSYLHNGLFTHCGLRASIRYS